MRKSKAIKILEKQKQIFIDRSYSSRDTWKQLTASYISDFFGADSGEYYSFFHFQFGVLTSNVYDENIQYKLDSKNNAMIGLLDNFIIKLKNTGLYKKPKANILSDTNNATLFGLSLTILIVVFGIGYYFGTEKTNRDLIQTEIRYKNLKDSLSSVKPFVDTKSVSDEKK
jgi:hypothetical protein